MLKSKLLNQNRVELAKMTVLLSETCKFLDTLFEKMETEDPRVKETIMSKMEGLFGAMVQSNNLLQENNEEIIGLEEMLTESTN